MVEKSNTEATIDIQQLWGLLRKNIISLVIWMLVGGILAFIISFIFMTPKYSATTDILVNQKVDNAQMQYNVQQADLQAINTYKDVLKKDVVLSPVLKQIRQQDNYKGNLEDLQNAISIENQTNSQVLSVTVLDKNAYTAADISNTIGSVFSKKIKKMMKVDNVTIVTKATADTTPVSPNKKLNILIGVVLGLIIGMAIIIIRDLLDTTVKDEKYLTNELGLVSLGAVSHMSKKTNRHAVSVLTNNGQSVMTRRRV
ncbi:Exopolysaccharide chain length regulator [Liquorilactobacillus aquaticus DSM 21051]|uniref:Capsular polysaccharide biosynthesis protein CpsC n=1 Tax=Liquorilactobacillus aquaticus DSM 21051 TaxID=1423725 RepID=A0A0R2CSZ3_9LACO|nr:Wzz/FepE/Etk N-terminal domain-containing protein [Liquorilactobacillus aquaticus]KRM94878.1 Exopolysaccharide chain length regulator [Liquorilactobacillus aquaticus DSM 21051]